jgi:hypothetical protein
VIRFEVSRSEITVQRECRAQVKKDALKKKLKTPWSESASELYRPSDRRLSAK